MMKRIHLLGIVLLTLLVAGCTAQLPPAEEKQAESSSLVELTDGQTYHLTAEKTRKELFGKPFEFYAYNNQIPGPILKVQQGSSPGTFLKYRPNFIL